MAISGVSGENRHCCKVCLDLLYVVMPSFWQIHRRMTVSPLFFFSDHLSDELHHGQACSSSPAGHDALQASDAEPVPLSAGHLPADPRPSPCPASWSRGCCSSRQAAAGPCKVMRTSPTPRGLNPQRSGTSD